MNQSNSAAEVERIAWAVVQSIADHPHVQSIPGAFAWEELGGNEMRWIRAIVEVALAQPAPDATPTMHHNQLATDLASDATPAPATGSDGPWKASAQSGFAALRMVREAVEAFGPATSLESPEAVLLRGPEPTDEAEAIIEALGRLRHTTPRQPVSAAGSEPVAWLSVDKAPRDGTDILWRGLNRNGGITHCVVRWPEFDLCFEEGEWMPLPGTAAPSEPDMLPGLKRANALVPGGNRYIADEIARLEGREA